MLRTVSLLTPVLLAGVVLQAVSVDCAVCGADTATADARDITELSFSGKTDSSSENVSISPVPLMTTSNKSFLQTQHSYKTIYEVFDADRFNILTTFDGAHPLKFAKVINRRQVGSKLLSV